MIISRAADQPNHRRTPVLGACGSELLIPPSQDAANDAEPLNQSPAGFIGQRRRPGGTQSLLSELSIWHANRPQKLWDGKNLSRNADLNWTGRHTSQLRGARHHGVSRRQAASTPRGAGGGARFRLGRHPRARRLNLPRGHPEPPPVCRVPTCNGTPLFPRWADRQRGRACCPGRGSNPSVWFCGRVRYARHMGPEFYLQDLAYGRR
jgi:hypothetical protein